MLRLLDLFSGIGGFSYAAERIVGGFVTTQFVERDPYCQSVLHRHWPNVPIHNDITTYTPTPSSHDIITAGFPCQDISSAGKQAGLAGARSGLFYEVLRVARVIQPQFLVLENVANLVSHANGTTFQEILYQIAEAGFDAEWAVIPASDVGACHRRARCWIVAYATRLLGDGCSGEQPRQSTKQSLSQLRDCNWPEPTPRHTLNPDWSTFVSEPVISRGNDGIPHRLDRLKALGNAVVPQCAAVPLARVKILAARQELDEAEQRYEERVWQYWDQLTQEPQGGETD